MAVIRAPTISMEYMQLRGKGWSRVERTSDVITKIKESVIGPGGREYSRGELSAAMFVNPIAFTEALKHVYGQDLKAWQTTGPPEDEEGVDVGSLVGRPIRWGNRPTYTWYGTILRETVLIDDETGERYTVFLAVGADGSTKEINSRWTGRWEVLLGNRWLTAHRLVELARAERAGRKTSDRLTRRRVRVRSHSRRKP